MIACLSAITNRKAWYFVAKFKLGAGLDGPMSSLLNNVLAAMSKFDLGSVTKD